MLNTFPITLVESYMISPKVKHFTFNCEQSPPFNFIPGQFITVHFERDGKALKRSYSIANEPKHDNRIEFAAGFIEGGPGTELLFNLKPGDVIHINGPFGRLIFKEEMPGRYILVATSTGATPFRSMLGELSTRLNQNPKLQVVILQGVQRKEEILYTNEFKAFAQQYPQVLFRPCLSNNAGQLKPIIIPRAEVDHGWGLSFGYFIFLDGNFQIKKNCYQIFSGENVYPHDVYFNGVRLTLFAYSFEYNG